MDGTRFDEAMLASIIARINGFAYRCRNDADYSMMVIEGAVEVLTGRPAAAFIGEGARAFASVIHQSDLAAVSQAVDGALATRDAWQVDYRIIRADGAHQWVRETGGGVFGPDGSLLYLEGIIVDLTARKIEEAEKLVLQAQIAENCLSLSAAADPILSILRQLRILAVNARIEAARSGEGGAGFAIIAAEIGRIADDTSARASRVTELTQQLQRLLAAS